MKRGTHRGRGGPNPSPPPRSAGANRFGGMVVSQGDANAARVWMEEGNAAYPYRSRKGSTCSCKRRPGLRQGV